MGYIENPSPYTAQKPGKTLIRKALEASPLLLVVFLLILFFSAKSDHQLMKEFVEKNEWASLVHLSAVQRLCKKGNELACTLLKDPRAGNGYTGKLSSEKVNATTAELFEGRHNQRKVSTLFNEVFSSNTKYPDLDAIFEAGMKEIKRMNGMTEGLINEIAWILLEHGYDPTDWLER